MLQNSQEKFNALAEMNDIFARFPALSQEEVQEPLDIKNEILSFGDEAFLEFYSEALPKFIEENPDASNYVAYHLSSGSGMSQEDLAAHSFDYDDGRIMTFLRGYLEKAKAEVVE